MRVEDEAQASKIAQAEGAVASSRTGNFQLSHLSRANLSPWRRVACWSFTIVANTYAMLFAWRYSRIPATQKMRFGLPARIGR
jgi:hypothetical protein